MNKMRRLITLLSACVLLLPSRGEAQFEEIGTFIGIANYAGDLTESNLDPLEFNLAAGFYLRHHFKRRLALKLHLYRGVLSGNDANASLAGGLWKRNLKFRTEVYELGAQLEYDLIKFGTDNFYSAPYLFFGISVFHFNPRTELDGKTYNLQKYKTEGVEYSLLQMAIPFGAGFKIKVNDAGSLGVEVGFRKTFTDYLDDVSGAYPADIAALTEQRSLQSRLSYRTSEVLPDAPPVPKPGQLRGNPDNKDWYFFFGFTLGVYLKK